MQCSEALKAHSCLCYTEKIRLFSLVQEKKLVRFNVLINVKMVVFQSIVVMTETAC